MTIGIPHPQFGMNGRRVACPVCHEIQEDRVFLWNATEALACEHCDVPFTEKPPGACPVCQEGTVFLMKPAPPPIVPFCLPGKCRGCFDRETQTRLATTQGGVMLVCLGCKRAHPFLKGEPMAEKLRPFGEAKTDHHLVQTPQCNDGDPQVVIDHRTGNTVPVPP